jgi:hypothetical protein
MFGSDILEVSIGIVFVFVLVSTICSAVREAFEALLKTRASYLEFGIRQLLRDPEGKGLAKELFEHPLISSLFAGEYVPGGQRRRWWRGRNLPSYIPSRSFAVALIDLFNTSGKPDIANPKVQQAVRLAMDSAHGNLELARQNVEAWYDSTMDRVSRWYKRSTQWIIFAIALGIAGGANIDTLAIADYLYRHSAVRSTIVSTVEKTAGTASESYLPAGNAAARRPESSSRILVSDSSIATNPTSSPRRAATNRRLHRSFTLNCSAAIAGHGTNRPARCSAAAEYRSSPRTPIARMTLKSATA